MPRFKHTAHRVSLTAMFATMTLLFLYLSSIIPVLRITLYFFSSVFVMGLLLEEELSLSDVLINTEIPGLRFLAGGPIPPNPSELLELPRMKAIIESLCQEADVVLFDSPPALAVTDASVLAARVGGTLLVIDAGRTRTDECRKALEALSRVGANVLGIVLNRVASNGSSSYYYYSSAATERPGQRSKLRRKGLRRHRPERGLVSDLAHQLENGAVSTGSKGGRRRIQWFLIALLIIFDLVAIAALVLLLIGGI